MDNSQNTPHDKNSSSIGNAVSLGADLGAKAGCLLSLLYSLLSFPAILAILGMLDFAPRLIGLALSLYMLIINPIVLLLGGITGAVLGWLSRILSSVIPQPRFFQVGMLLCVIFLVVLHAAFFLSSPQVFEDNSVNRNGSNNDNAPLADILFTPLGGYLIFIGFPSLLYIAGGGWVSYQLALKPNAA